MDDKKKIEHRCIKCHKLLAIGELKSTQIEIKCSRCKQINFFFDKEPDQVIITDTDGVILYTNPSLTDLTGYTVTEMLGKRPSLWGGRCQRNFIKIYGIR